MIAYKRNEISLRKFIVFSTSSIVIGVIVASVLPFGYQKIFEYINYSIKRPSKSKVFFALQKQQSLRKEP